MFESSQSERDKEQTILVQVVKSQFHNLHVIFTIIH